MSRRKRIGIMGGTFDPVHMVHLTLAENAYHSFGLDEVMMLPNGDPPHKTDKIITPAVHRMAMLQRAVEGIPYFSISDMEIRREGYSYSSVTLEELKNLLYGGLISVENPVIMVSQTTFNRLTWEKCVKFAKTLYTNLLVFDTICNATVERQSEAVALSQVCDGMVIVGGRQSSNTAKLKDVCAANCPGRCSAGWRRLE